MKRLRLPLLQSNTIIQVARLLSFTCVLRYHTSSQKVKGLNLISSNSVVGAQLLACWFANPKLHQFLKPGQLPTPALPKRLSLIFSQANFPRGDSIPIVNTLLNTVRICGGKLGAHSYLASPKNNKETDNFGNFPPLLFLTC